MYQTRSQFISMVNKNLKVLKFNIHFVLYFNIPVVNMLKHFSDVGD